MTRREAKIKALRIATALLNGGGSDEDDPKVHAELEKLAAVMQRRAEVLGGEFNPYMGRTEEEIKKLNGK